MNLLNQLRILHKICKIVIFKNSSSMFCNAIGSKLDYNILLSFQVKWWYWCIRIKKIEYDYCQIMMKNMYQSEPYFEYFIDFMV